MCITRAHAGLRKGQQFPYFAAHRGIGSPRFQRNQGWQALVAIRVAFICTQPPWDWIP